MHGIIDGRLELDMGHEELNNMSVRDWSFDKIHHSVHSSQKT